MIKQGCWRVEESILVTVISACTHLGARRIGSYKESSMGKDGHLLQSEETDYLLGPPTIPYALYIESSSSSITTAGYDSMQSQLILIPHNNDGELLSDSANIKSH